jgi:ABC-type amino acid transport substrate-binding protein
MSIPVYCLLFAVCGLLSGCAASKPDLAWGRIQEQGVIRVGMEANWVPFEYVDGTGQLAGFDVALARALGDRLGLEVQFHPTLSFDGLYDALTARQVDVVISAVVVDMGRSADFAYSTPYFDAGQVLVVGPDGADGSTLRQHPEPRPELAEGLVEGERAEVVDGMRDLSGRVLAVELGSDGDTVARRWARRLAGLSLLHTDSADAALDAVASGRADAALVDRATALMALRAYGDASSGLHISGAPVTDEQYAVVMLKQSGELLHALNAALDDMHRNGTLAELEREWLGP